MDVLVWFIVRQWMHLRRTGPVPHLIYIALSVPIYVLIVMVWAGGRQAVDRQTLYYLASVLFPVLAFKLGCLGLYPLLSLFERLLRMGKSKSAPSSASAREPTSGIGRRVFLHRSALLLTGLPGMALVYGIFRGASQLTVFRKNIHFPELPDGFDGLRIVQLSDLHTGSFLNDELIRRTIAQVEALKPDLICFTGDLVNNFSSEATPFIPLLQKLKAPMGVLSILGNHDYGDYVRWQDPVARQANFEEMLAIHRRLGWRLLRNQHVLLEREGTTLPVIGVENWSQFSRFPRYGDLPKAARGTGKFPFSILLSHDPSHWEGQVVDQYPHIGLTLSGHTHGMQFGVDIPGFKWSPVQWVYRQWAGLYQHQQQRLYVNRGLGFIGYPGRVGIWPEISLITLNKSPQLL